MILGEQMLMAITLGELSRIRQLLADHPELVSTGRPTYLWLEPVS
jgi:hypothetical protein